MSSPDARIVACPTCRKSVPWMPESRWRPFCSDRCRLIDLGEWAAESHRIAGGADDNDVSSGDLQDQQP